MWSCHFGHFLYGLIVVVVAVVVRCGSSLKLWLGPIPENKYNNRKNVNLALFEVTNDEMTRQRQHASGTKSAAALILQNSSDRTV